MSKRQSTLFNYFSSPKVLKEDDKNKIVDNDNEEIKVPKKRRRQVIDDSSESENESDHKKTTKKAHRSCNGSEAENVSPGDAKKTNKKSLSEDESNDTDKEKESPKKPTKLFSFKKESQNESIKETTSGSKEIKGKKKSNKKTISEDESDDTDIEKESPKKPAKFSFKQKSQNESVKETTNGSKDRKKTNKKAMSEDESDDTDIEKSPKKSAKLFSFKKESQNESVKETTNVSTSNANKEVKDIHSSWLHNTLDFLKPEKIMDINKKKPDHPQYDSRTLYVPEKYLNTLTPAMRQWWELKSHHMDSVLFFKVGKFYELYHMDAVVGVTQLGFSYMKGEFAHSGFPESAYDKMVNLLMDKGYKVARVEQTETPEMLAERCKASKSVTKFDKVVKREICQISAKGTYVYTAQTSDWQNEVPYFLYALSMKEGSYGTARIGVCFVETSMGMFRLTEFDDDKHFSRLLALFTEYPPTVILIEKGGTNKQLTELLYTHFKDVKKESLISKTQFYTASDTLEKLSSMCYFRNKEGEFHWPDFFKTVADDCVPKSNCELTLKSLGACMWYLKNSKLDIQVFSLKKYEWYNPLNFTSKEKRDQDYLVLDAVTISNLELLGSSRSLKYFLDKCETAFGKRLLVRWICRPLCDLLKIKERQNAVKYLLEHSSLLKSTQAILKQIPDLERLLMKIHTYGNKFLSTAHPDGRAIFYEAKTYSTNKIKDFLKTLKAFEKAIEIVELFEGCEDHFLKKITQYEPEGMFTDLSEILKYFMTAFDQQEAEKEGKIIPKAGVVEEFDEIENTITEINKNLDKYLEKQCKIFGCKVIYVGNDKKRYQLEVPEHKSHKATDEYKLEGTKKGAKASKKFTTETTRELLAEMMEAEANKEKLILDLNRQIFEKFSAKSEQFDRVVQCLTILDVLCSLAEYARTYSYDICLPKVLPFSDEPKLIIENGRHPCTQNVDNFIPNDCKMGVEGFPSLLIITGANMGGKSTLMRQIAVISIMAQMGSFVPASSCELNLIDRIFTRLGAQDDISKGQSTFYVELSEASSILQYATRHSLVIIDELGRGTSTHDGNAIATSYVNKLSEFKCRTTFSTHYHSLVDNFLNSSDVQLGHMACMVERNEDPTLEHVTFLYKIASGRCPKSYGFNAARLAGLDRQLIIDGMEIAKKFEEQSRLRNIFQLIMKKNISNIREELASLSV